MDWFAQVDIYCERAGPGFWAEPANAITNASFLLAALWGAVEARRRAEPNPLVWVLVGLAAAIGIGSFLFHTVATVWAGLADVLPIWTFVALYVLVALNRLAGMRPGRIAVGALAGVGVIALVVAMGEGGGEAEAAAAAPDPFNGSLQYLPAVIAFAVFAVITQRRRHPLRHWVLGAMAVFMLSLAFRTADRDICGSIALGTHWLWHLLNGLMIGLVLQILIRAPRPGAAPG